jgi:16S rRNA processing protein RimM
MIVMGRIAGAYGVKGWLKINSFARPAERVGDYRPWRLRDQRREIEVSPVAVKRHGKGLIVKLAGIDDRDQAETMSGLEILVDRTWLPDPEAGHYYWTDLEGLQVVDTAGRQLGRVDHLIAAGAADVMVINGSQRLLVPFVLNETVVRVDLDAGEIEVDWEPVE